MAREDLIDVWREEPEGARVIARPGVVAHCLRPVERVRHEVGVVDAALAMAGEVAGPVRNDIASLPS